ncbi:hypothetical protein GNP44_00485 [Aliivibrio fischeri]|nr:hypothetical protein [Aliivibrio fischeri]MUK66693.1 hypothetical protein [Aliivibrio fischeri]
MEMVVDKNMCIQDLCVKKQTQIKCDASVGFLLSPEEVSYIEMLLDVKIIFANTFSN